MDETATTEAEAPAQAEAEAAATPPTALQSLSDGAKRDILKSLDFVARRESIAGDALEQASAEMRTALGVN